MAEIEPRSGTLRPLPMVMIKPPPNGQLCWRPSSQRNGEPTTIDANNWLGVLPDGRCIMVQREGIDSVIDATPPLDPPPEEPPT